MCRDRVTQETFQYLNRLRVGVFVAGAAETGAAVGDADIIVGDDEGIDVGEYVCPVKVGLALTGVKEGDAVVGPEVVGPDVGACVHINTSSRLQCAGTKCAHNPAQPSLGLKSYTGLQSTVAHCSLCQ
jgi:hypothetical protein